MLYEIIELYDDRWQSSNCLNKIGVLWEVKMEKVFV